MHFIYLLYLADYREGGWFTLFRPLISEWNLRGTPYPPQGLMHLKVVSGRSGCHATGMTDVHSSGISAKSTGAVCSNKTSRRPTEGERDSNVVGQDRDSKSTKVVLIRHKDVSNFFDPNTQALELVSFNRARWPKIPHGNNHSYAEEAGR